MTSSAGRDLLPHYSRSAAVERRADGSLVADFIARRPLVGVLGLGLPVAWRSRTWSERAGPAAALRPRGGRDPRDGRHLADRAPTATARMWSSSTSSGRGCRASPPSSTGSSRARSPAGRWPRSRRSPRLSSPKPRPGESIDMTDRRRVWITGIGLVTPIGTGVDAFRAGLREGRSPVKRIDRFDPSPFRSQVAAQVDDFDPLAWMPPKTARQLDRFSQFGMVAGRLALDDARLTPGADGAASPERIGIYLGSALGGHRLRRGAAHALPREGNPPGRPEPRAGGVRRRGPGQSRHRARRPRPDPVDGELVRLGRGGARGGARATCARAGSTPRSPVASRSRCRRSRSARSTSSARCRRGTTTTPGHAARPFDVGRDGFVMGEGAALLVLEDADVAERRGATPYAELLGYGATSDAHHMVQPRADGREAARAATIALEDAGAAPDGDRLRQRPRVLDPDRRRRRGAGDRHGARRPRRDGAGEWHEGAVRAPARGIGRDRGRDLRARDPRWLGAGLGQPGRAGSGDPRDCSPGLLREGRDGTYRRVLSTSFGFGGLNAALVFGAVD